MKQIHPNRALKHLRAVIGMSQSEFAELIGCLLPTIKAIEGGKLALSERMAERISCETGVWFGWLLENNLAKPPTTITIEGYPPFTAETFKLHRETMTEEVSDEILLSAFSLHLDLIGAILRFRRSERKTPHAIHRINEELSALVREFNVPVVEFSTAPEGRKEIESILLETGLAKHYLGIQELPTPPSPKASAKRSRASRAK